VKARDPVIVLAEMDEIGLGKVEGDPIEAMEEVLDWDNRVGFVDRYIDLPFDLSGRHLHRHCSGLLPRPRERCANSWSRSALPATRPRRRSASRRRSCCRASSRTTGWPDGIEFTDEGLLFLAYGYARDAGVGMQCAVPWRRCCVPAHAP
jgi:ATP-dependent Lon protease